MTSPNTLTTDLIDSWADDPQGPVALHLKQRLIPVEGENGVIFPPTYADIGYNMDTLSDSRGDSAEKRPRLVRSVIRAWDVEPLHAAAQFNSVWKSLNQEQQDALEKEAKAQKVKLSVKGLADAPANSKTGGVVSHGEIVREVTVNLVALRALQGANKEETKNIRRYLLALSLIAASAELNLYLREGCHLRFADDRDLWHIVPRRGEPTQIEMESDKAQKILLDYGETAVKPFKDGWPEQHSYQFDIKEAKKLLAKKEETENDPDK